jgi:hypothetical protein
MFPAYNLKRGHARAISGWRGRVDIIADGADSDRGLEMKLDWFWGVPLFAPAEETTLVAQTLAMLYDIAGAVAQTLAALWDINGLAANTKQFLWDLGGGGGAAGGTYHRRHWKDRRMKRKET